MPRPPEQAPHPERNPFPFFMASRFASRETSQAPYETIQSLVREREEADFSVFRLIQTWSESISQAPPSEKRWYVAVIGHIPPEPLAQQVREAITTGEVVPLPDEVIAQLAERRRIETAQRSYTEIHRTFTL